METDSRLQINKQVKPANNVEINSWRRGFTPQAEIWNGRMAMVGLFVAFLIIYFFVSNN